MRRSVGALNTYAMVFVALCGLAITIETGVTILLAKCIGVLQSSAPATVQTRRADAEVWLRLLKERHDTQASPAEQPDSPQRGVSDAR